MLRLILKLNLLLRDTNSAAPILNSLMVMTVLGILTNPDPHKM